MNQETTIPTPKGKIVSSYLKVERAKGGVEYYKVVNDENVKITEAEYQEAHK